MCLAKQGFTPYPIVQCINKYTVVAGDTCDTISLNTRIALASILSYNPGLDCTALQVGQYICLDSAGLTVPTLASTTQTPIPTIILSTLAPTTAAPTVASTTTVPIIVTTPASTTTASSTVTNVADMKCTNKYTIQAGDTCSSISSSKHIDITLYNPGNTRLSRLYHNFISFLYYIFKYSSTTKLL